MKRIIILFFIIVIPALVVSQLLNYFSTGQIYDRDQLRIIYFGGFAVLIFAVRHFIYRKKKESE
jgi:hypothetical protein